MPEKYESDLPDLPSVSKEKIFHWQKFWRHREKEEVVIPDTAGTALGACNSVRFPNVKVLLRILCTMTLTSAECERSFSTMRRLKSYLGSTMCAQRLNGLALMAIHRSKKIDVTAVKERFMTAKNRILFQTVSHISL